MSPIDYWLIGLGAVVFWLLAFRYVRFHTFTDDCGHRVWSFCIHKLLVTIGRMP